MVVIRMRQTVDSDAMWAELDMLESAPDVGPCPNLGDYINWVTTNGMVLPHCRVVYVYPSSLSVLVSTPHGYFQNVPLSQILGQRGP